MTNELIVRFVNEVCRSRIFKPRIAVCVPAQITGVEADAVVESVMGAGAKQVFLVDEPVAAALGAGLQIREPHGCMVVDTGGGSTDIAVISMVAVKPPACRWQATPLTAALPSMCRKNSRSPSVR